MSNVIIIAVDAVDAFRWWDSQPHLPWFPIVVTVRSPHNAWDQTAEAILATPRAQAHPKYQELLEQSLPAVMARPR